MPTRSVGAIVSQVLSESIVVGVPINCRGDKSLNRMHYMSCSQTDVKLGEALDIPRRRVLLNRPEVPARTVETSNLIRIATLKRTVRSQSVAQARGP
jgi:hypothetical protein